MNKVRTILVLLLLSMHSLAQNSWDTYITQFNNATLDKDRLIALDSIVKNSFRQDNEVFFEYSFKFIELAKKLENYNEAAKKAMNLSYPLSSANRPADAIATIDDILRFKEKITDSFLVGGLYLKRGGGYFRTDINKSVADYTQAIKNFGVKDSLYVADAYLFRGQANVSLGDFVAASQDYNVAYKYFEQLEDYEYMQHAKQGVTMMYSMNGFYDKALEERQNFINKLLELGLDEYLATAYYNQAIDDRKINNRQKAFNMLLEAQKYIDASNNKNNMFFAIHGLLSTHYIESGNQKKAAYHLSLLDDLYNPENKDLLIESHYNSAKAGFLTRIGKQDEALVYAKKKLENARNLGVEEEIIHALEDLYQIYERKGDLEKSLAYYKTYNQKKDSLFNQNKTNSLLYYQSLYESEKKERELVAQQSNIALLEQENNYFKKGIFLIGLLSVLTFGVFYLIREKRYLKRSQKMQQNFSQKLLISQETERRRIAKELHDGLGQNLLLIKNRVYNQGDSNSGKMIDGAIEEVRTISRDLHPFKLQELGLTKAIENMLQNIDQNTELFVATHIDNIDGLFSKEQEVNIYRIIQESYNNIIKHAAAKASRIEIKKAVNSLIITIQDNGKGFNFIEQYKDSKSLGLKTLKERTRFLEGAVKITSESNQGTHLYFKIPLS